MVIVFARAPVAGRAKTRLGARLGEARAARLAARLTANAVRTALASRCGPVELHATSPHRLLLALARALKVPLRAQRGRDLGERMDRATRVALRARRGVILIGADCPALAPGDLRRAARLLHGGADAVLAPAEDGGYALIAVRRPAGFLFSDMPWGGERVYRETVSRLARAAWRWRALRTLWDVDRPQDLDRLAARVTLLRPSGGGYR